LVNERKPPAPPRLRGVRIAVTRARTRYRFIYRSVFRTGDGAKVVETVGATIIQECDDDRQIRALKSLGGNMYHFLTTLDGVHDVLQMSDDKVRKAAVRFRQFPRAFVTPPLGPDS